jgi:hypothetical protein
MQTINVIAANQLDWLIVAAVGCVFVAVMIR